MQSHIYNHIGIVCHFTEMFRVEPLRVESAGCSTVEKERYVASLGSSIRDFINKHIDLQLSASAIQQLST